MLNKIIAETPPLMSEISGGGGGEGGYFTATFSRGRAGISAIPEGRRDFLGW